MALPTVASLCRALGKDLHPADGFVVPETPVTAVHVSELVDPTSYVSGGELLLTTGLILPTSRIGWEGYVSRLKSIGIAALGIGLGPRYSEPPDALVEACKASGLSLLIVPDPTPFLTISKTYWTARARSSERHFQDEVAAHRALIDAAASPDPPAEVLRRLARAVDGRAAKSHLDRQARSDSSRRLGRGGGSPAVRGGPSGGRWCPLSCVVRRGWSIRGDLAFVGGGDRGGLLGRRHDGEAVPATHRRIVLTAVALLSIDSFRWQRRAPARDATARCVAALVDLGHIGAARQLAAAEGLPMLHREGRVLLVRARDSENMVRVVASWSADVLAVAITRAESWYLLPSAHPRLAEPESVAIEGGPDGVGGRFRARSAGGHRNHTVPVGGAGCADCLAESWHLTSSHSGTPD